MKDDLKGKVLGAILLQSQMLTPEQIEHALAEQERTGGRFGEVLVSLGIVSQEDVNWGLSQQKSYSFVRVNPEFIDEAAINAVPADVAYRHDLLPYLLIGNDLTVVMDDPSNQEAVAELVEVTGSMITVCIGLIDEIRAALDVCYGGLDPEELSVEIVGDLFSPKESEKCTADNTGGVFVDLLLEKAGEAGADEIHFETGETVELRLRINGKLEHVASLGRARMRLVARRIHRMLRQTSGGDEIVEGILSAGKDGDDVMFHAACVRVTNGEAITLTRMSPVQSVEDLLDDGVSAGLVEPGPGLLVLSGSDGPDKQRIVRLIMDQVSGKDIKAVYVGRSPLMTGASLVRMRPESDSPSSRIKSIDAGLSLNPDLLVVEDVLEQGVLDKCLKVAAGGRQVIGAMNLSSAATAVEYLVEAASSRTVLGRALRGVLHLAQVRLLIDEDAEPDDRVDLAADLLDVPVEDIESGGLRREAPNAEAGRLKPIVAPLVADAGIAESIRSGASPGDIAREAGILTTKRLCAAMREDILDGKVSLDELIRLTESSPDSRSVQDGEA